MAERAAYHESGHCPSRSSITFRSDVPHVHRAHYRPPPGLGLEAMGIFCLSGPASEEYFCGRITDGSDWVDIEIAREYLFAKFNVFTIAAEIARLRAAADRLVRTPSVQNRIRLIADALLRHGTLTGADISAL